MPNFRIFTNGRRKQNGVLMYSCLKGVRAASPEAAVSKVHEQFGPPNFGLIKAIEWPVKTEESKQWLQKHVG